MANGYKNDLVSLLSYLSIYLCVGLRIFTSVCIAKLCMYVCLCASVVCMFNKVAVIVIYVQFNV